MAVIFPPYSAGGTSDPATTTTPGIVELATDEETAAGTDTTRVATPSGVALALEGLPAATVNTAGLIELATEAESATGTAVDRAITPLGLASVLADLSGLVYITTTTGILPGDLPENTLIARYAGFVPATPVITPVGSTTSVASGNTVVVTTSADIPAGDAIVVALVRAATVSDTTGTAVVTMSAGVAGTWTRASACRGGLAEVSLLSATVTTTIPSGTTITITTTGNTQNRKMAAVAGVAGVETGVPEATSGDDATGLLGNVNSGTTSSSATSLTPATDGSTTTVNSVVFGAWAFNPSANWGAADTSVADIATAAGSSDRGLVLGWKSVAVAGVQSIAATSPTAGAVAGVSLALPIEMVAE